jgi:hypothetical protein
MVAAISTYFTALINKKRARKERQWKGGTVVSSAQLSVGSVPQLYK